MDLLRKIFTILIVLAMIAAGILFALQNTVLVPLDLLFYSFAPKSLALWVLSAFAIGGLIGMLTASMIVLRLRTSMRITKRQLERNREELEKFRTAGLKDGD